MLSEVRIIPARAGFTPWSPSPSSAPADHPRSRGVYGPLLEAHIEHLGIIPARAGFTAFSLLSASSRGDHPRSRGVYPGHPGGDPGPVWIIPARAGFTERKRGRHNEHGDHPRSRGVYGREARVRDEAAGSSPLARGLRGGVSRSPRAGRIIPARAGFTRTENFLMGMEEDHPRSRGVYFRRSR